MAGRGSTPKQAGKKARRNAEPWADLGEVSSSDPGGLPDGYRFVWFSKAERFEGDFEWLPATRAWWEMWRQSPQAARFLPSDWSALSRLAVLVDRFHREASTSLAAEIRLQESSFGATVADRLRLRWEVAVVGPDEMPAGSVPVDEVAQRRAGRESRLA